MSLARKLFINWHTKKRQRSDQGTSGDYVDRLSFLKYENAPFEVVIVEPVPSGNINAFVRVPVTDLSMKMAINDTLDDSTPLAEQTTWTKNSANNTFTGLLDLNTGLMSAYITADKTPYFEIEITDSAGARVKILSEQCDVRMGVLTTTTVSPDPSKVYLELDVATGLFIAKELGDQETITFRNGIYRRQIGVNPDGSPLDNLYSV
jgi:hypothetical protein